MIWLNHIQMLKYAEKAFFRNRDTTICNTTICNTTICNTKICKTIRPQVLLQSNHCGNVEEVCSSWIATIHLCRGYDNSLPSWIKVCADKIARMSTPRGCRVVKSIVFYSAGHFLIVLEGDWPIKLRRELKAELGIE